MSTTMQQGNSIEMEAETFAEKFCARHRISPAEYENEMLRLSLYLPGKFLRPLLSSKANYFAPDREFVRAVGKLTRVHGFGAEVWSYAVNPENCRFVRHYLKMRVSAKKVYQQLIDALGQRDSRSQTNHSLPPF
jgi:hypothetical protein